MEEPQDKAQLSPIQRAILRIYDKDGDFSGVESLRDAEQCGDGLLLFLLKETADCEKSEALHRLRCAWRDLDNLIEGLLSMKPGEEFAQDVSGPEPM